MFQEYRNECRLPVVAVDDIRSPAQTRLADRHHGADFAKQLEPVGVVPPVPAFLVLVGVSRPIKQWRAVHQPECDRGTRQPGLPETDFVLSDSEPNFSAGTGLSCGLDGSRVSGQENMDVVFQPAKGLGQACRYVCKTSGFHQWVNLTGGE